MRTNDNRLTTFIVLRLFLFTSLMSPMSYAAALGADGQTAETSDDVFTFDKLGYIERLMLSPYDLAQISFGLPSNWALAPGAEITLRFNYASNRAISSVNDANALAGGTLRVSFNGVTLRTIVLGVTGNIIETIPISEEALKPSSADGRYRISFVFDSRFDCGEAEANSSLIISASSSITLKHTIVPIAPDLTIFPRPLYQANSIIPSQTTIVIPDTPSESEMRAALSVAAGLGSLTNAKLQYRLIPVSQLTEAQKTDTNLVLIGMPNTLPILTDARLPNPLQNDTWALDGMQPDDGLVQMAVSPWSQNNVMLVVSANSEAGLIKAAQAVSTGKIVPTGRPDVSVVSAVNPLSMSDNIPQDQTLSSLGYDNQPLGGFEGTYASYFFPASADQVSSIGAYLDIVTSHTSLLDYERSGMTVYLNRKFIGSIKFTGDAEQITTSRLDLLPGVIRRGNNLLEFYSDLVPIYNCYSPDLSSNTVIISALTNIHLPVGGQQLGLNTLINLNDYPLMFTTDRNLSNLALVVARNDPTGWDVASRIAFDIGASASIPIANLEVSFGDSVPQAIREQRGLIIVGRASTLALLNEINQALPAPFAPGGDEAIQPALLVNYRLLPGVTVGYLQLIPSPWNSEQTILVVAGNTQAGVLMAGEKLIRPEFNSQLNGNFSVIHHDQILTTDTRLGQSKEPLISSLPVEEALATPTQPIRPAPGVLPDDVEIETRPSWILPAIIAMSIATILLLLILVGQVLMSKKSHAKKQPGYQPGKE